MEREGEEGEVNGKIKGWKLTRIRMGTRMRTKIRKVEIKIMKDTIYPSSFVHEMEFIYSLRSTILIHTYIHTYKIYMNIHPPSLFTTPS